MEAIRQFIKVNGHTIDSILSDDFNADKVEVIIMPKNDDPYFTDEMRAILDSTLHEPAESYIRSEKSIKKLKKKYGL